MVKPRKVALFSTSFLPYSQTFIYDEIRAHDPDKYTVEVFCKDRLNEKRFPFENYHKPRSKVAEYLYQNIAYWPAFDKIIKSGGFDLVHAHFGTGAVYALPYVKKYDIPFVVTFHGNDVAALMGTQKYKYDKWRYCLKSKQIFEHADLLLAASEELKELLIELGAHQQKTRIYRLGIDLEKFSYAEPAQSEIIRFVMIGRFTPKKGHRYALRAFNNVIKQGYNASFTFIGAGRLMDDAKAYAASNDLTSRIDFKGILPPAKVSQCLKESDVLIAPSVVALNQDRESGLIVIKEAAGIGRPAIGTWHGGIHEIIEDGKTGYLVPERNVEALTDRMIKLIENPDLRKRFGAAGRQKMEQDFDFHSQVVKLEQYYEELLSTDA